MAKDKFWVTCQDLTFKTLLALNPRSGLTRSNTKEINEAAGMPFDDVYCGIIRTRVPFPAVPAVTGLCSNPHPAAIFLA